ncbi:MAG TPA: hypothetical protein VMM13_00625, partial [Euzebya sp.]|nr:hypothetical protein [Euzebya sp.]
LVDECGDPSLRAGLRAMEAAEMELVKPDPDRAFSSLEEAIYDDGPAQTPPPVPRKIPPPRR